MCEQRMLHLVAFWAVHTKTLQHWQRGGDITAGNELLVVLCMYVSVCPSVFSDMGL